MHIPVHMVRMQWFLASNPNNLATWGYSHPIVRDGQNPNLKTSMCQPPKKWLGMARFKGSKIYVTPRSSQHNPKKYQSWCPINIHESQHKSQHNPTHNGVSIVAASSLSAAGPARRIRPWHVWRSFVDWGCDLWLGGGRFLKNPAGLIIWSHFIAL